MNLDVNLLPGVKMLLEYEEASMGRKQSYTSSMDMLEAGFVACWQNIRDLVASAKLLKEHGQHAPALSLSVLALEEMGKLIALDGLLLAIQGDDKSKLHRKVSRSHKDKLLSLELLPLLLDALSRQDPRYENEDRFRLAFAIGVKNLKDAGNVVMSLLGEESFTALDVEKQKGFYASLGQQSVVAPRDAVSKELSDAVFKFVELADGNLNFALKDGNLDRYISLFRQIREKLSREDHEEIRSLARDLAGEIFELDQDDREIPNH